MTVSALKIDDFYISKSEIVGNMLNDDDEIFCVLSKAKPKFPNCPNLPQNLNNNSKYWMTPQNEKQNNKKLIENEPNFQNVNNKTVALEARKSKKQVKK